MSSANIGVYSEVVNNGPIMQTNATLRHEDWVSYDRALVRVSKLRLIGVEDLRSRGLVQRLSGIGDTISLYERSSDLTSADVSMSGKVESDYDRITFEQVSVPVPVIHKDWNIDARQLEASRKSGTPLNTATMEVAARVVSDALEDCLFNGNDDLKVAGATLYGYTTEPNRNTVTLAGSGWAVKTGRDVIGDTEKMLDKLYNANFTGPFVMYVAKNVWGALQGDYSASKGDRTYRERILSFSDIEAVRVTGSLADSSVLIVQMTSDVVDLVVGQDLINGELRTDFMETRFKTYIVAAPRIKSDMEGNSGIAHGSV